MAILFMFLASVGTFIGRIRIAWRWVWRVLFLCFWRFFFLSLFFLIGLLELLSFDELYLFADESDNNGSGSGSPSTCDFPFCSGKSVGSVGESVGCVRRVGYIFFVLTGIKSIGDVVLLVMFVPREVESKGGRLIELFWRPKSWFSLLVSKSVLEI